jgi:acetyl esterase/lipase
MIYFIVTLTVVNMNFIIRMLYLYIVSRIFNIRGSQVELDIFKTVPHNLYIRTDDNCKIGAYLLRPAEINEETRFAVYLHGVGSSRNCTTRYATYDVLVEKGYCLLIIDYRGFADSEGAFTLHGSVLDTKAGFRYLMNEFNARDIILIGHSLGTGVATEYTRYVMENNLTSYKPHKLVLLSPFTSLPDACNDHPYWGWGSFFLGSIARRFKEEFEFNTLANLGHINLEDVLIYHGFKDPVISFVHTLKIREKYGVFVEITDNDHVNIIHDKRTWHKIDVRISGGDAAVTDFLVCPPELSTRTEGALRLPDQWPGQKSRVT